MTDSPGTRTSSSLAIGLALAISALRPASPTATRLCGHAWNPAVNQVSVSQNLRIGLNAAGHPVYQVLTDYQGNRTASSCGDGWLRLLEFDLERQAIHFTTYSPVLDRRAGQGGEWTFNQPPTFSDFTLPIPVQVVGATSVRAAQAR